VNASPSRQELQRQVAELTARMHEAEEALSAIREGDVDAIVITGSKGEQVFSLAGADSVYRLIVESMQEAALTVTPRGRILFCNKQFSAMLHIPLEELVGRNLATLVAAEEQPLLESLLRATRSRPIKGRVSFRGSTGSIPALVSASFLSQPDGPSICIVAADLSDLEASEAHLRRSNADLQKNAVQLRSLAEELAQAEERERRRLATILHDGLQQLLVGAQLHMHRVIADGGKRASPYSTKVVELLDQSIEMSRTLALEISPPIRIGAGLTDALKWLARSMEAKYSLKVKVTQKGAIDPVAEEISVLLFRSVQELLLNVVKHAGVRDADLHLEVRGHHLRISVSDKGRGFEGGDKEQGSGVTSFGLFSIQERISLIGGSMEARSQPGVGSRFTLFVPLASLRNDGAAEAPAKAASSRRRRRSGHRARPAAGTGPVAAGKVQ
jgi:PAS domain S-box-containing protein